MLTTHPHLQCRGLKVGRAIPLSALRALGAYKGRTFTVRRREKGTEREREGEMNTKQGETPLRLEGKQETYCSGSSQTALARLSHKGRLEAR